MADDNEVKIIIKAVNDASDVFKLIAKDIRAIAESTKKIEAAMGAASKANKDYANSAKGVAKQESDQAKSAKLLAQAQNEQAKAANTVALGAAKVATEEERAAAIIVKANNDIAKSAAQAALIEAKANTERARSNEVHWRDQLARAEKVAKITGDAAKADAQVALIQARTETERARAARVAAQEIENAAKRTVAAQNQIGASAQANTPSVEEFFGAIKAGAAKIVAALAAIGAFIAVAKKAIDFGVEGAQMERLAEAGDALARSYGVNLTEAVQKVKAASLDTISTQQAILSTNRALLLGVARDADQLAKLMEIAAIRGRATGLDTVEAFDRITLGIGRLSTRILDDIGIVVDGETAYANYGAAIGKTADELTEAEKRLALTSAIVKDGNELLLALGGVSEDSATKIAQLSTNVKDLGDNIKQGLAGPVAAAADILNTFLFGTQDLGEALRVQNDEAFRSSETYRQYTDAVRKAEEAQRGYIDALRQSETAQRVILDLVISSIPGIANLGQLYVLLGGSAALFASDADRLEESLVLQSEAMFNAANGAYTTEDSYHRMRAATEAAEEAQRLFAEAVEEASEAMRDFTGTLDDVEIGDAIEYAITQFEKLGAEEAEIDAIRLAFGLADQAVLDFGDSIAAAMEKGLSATQAFAGALQSLILAKLGALNDKFNKDLADLGGGGGAMRDLKGDLLDKLADIERDLADKMADIGRKLGDALADLAVDVANKREDIARDHARAMERIELDYQRNIDRIRQRFELSRIRALIDLDARALFEAELQRDTDLADAKKTAEEKREEERKNHEEELAELARFQAQREAELARDAARRAADAERDAQRRREDAQRDYEKALKDQKSAGGKSRKQLEEEYEKQRQLLLDQLALARDMEDGYFKARTGMITKDNHDREGLQKDHHGKTWNAQKSHDSTMLRMQHDHEGTKERLNNDHLSRFRAATGAWLTAVLGTVGTYFANQLTALDNYVDNWNRLVSQMRAPVPSGNGMPGLPTKEAALGQSVTAHDPRLIGERGVEMFIPSTSGRIASHAELASAVRSTSSSGNSNVHVTLEVKGEGVFAQWLSEMARDSAINVVADVLEA